MNMIEFKNKEYFFKPLENGMFSLKVEFGKTTGCFIEAIGTVTVTSTNKEKLWRKAFIKSKKYGFFDIFKSDKKYIAGSFAPATIKQYHI